MRPSIAFATEYTVSKITKKIMMKMGESVDKFVDKKMKFDLRKFEDYADCMVYYTVF